MFLFSQLRHAPAYLVLTIVVFSMSTGILGAVMFYSESAAPHVLDEFLDSVPVDMMASVTPLFYAQHNISRQDVVDTLLAQDLITNVTQICDIYRLDWESTDPRFVELYYVGVTQEFLEMFPRAVTPDSTSLPLDSNSCWVNPEYLEYLGLRIGDNLTISAGVWQEGLPIIINKTLTIVGTFSSQLFTLQRLGMPWGSEPVKVLTTYDALNSTFGAYKGLFHSGGDFNEHFVASVSHDALRGRDPYESLEALSDLSKRVEQALSPYIIITGLGYQLMVALDNYAQWLAAMRLIAIAFSVPTVIMGLMLIYYDSELRIDLIRRDSAVLRTRGASTGQVIRWVLGRALLTAILGSAGAVFVGIAGSLVGSSTRTFLSLDLSALGVMPVLVTPNIVSFVFVFTLIVGLVVSFSTIYRVLVISVAEAHQTVIAEITNEREKQTNWHSDFALFVCASYVLIPLLFISAYIVGAATSTMLIVVLALAIWSLARLLGRVTSRVKRGLLSRLARAKAWIPLRVLSGHARLAPRRELIAFIFGVMVFAAGTLSAVAATTGHEHVNQLHRFNVGADIVVTISPLAQNVTTSFADNLTAIEGVAGATPFLSASGRVSYIEKSISGLTIRSERNVQIFGIDPTTWKQNVFWLPYFSYRGTVDEVLNMMAHDNSTVMASFLPIVDWQQGLLSSIPIYGEDISVTIRANAWDNSSSCKARDALADLSTYRPYFPGEPLAEDFVVMNIVYVQACLRSDTVTKFYVRTEEGANATRVVERIRNAAPEVIASIESSDVEIARTTSSTSGRVMYGVYTLNVLFAILFLTAGSAIVAVANGARMRRSFTILRAEGMNPGPIARDTAIDAAVTTMLSAVTGSLIGLLFGYIAARIPLLYTGSSAIDWLRLPVILEVPVGLLSAIFALALSVVIVSTVAVTLRGLRRNIAAEIQYTE